MKKCFTRVEKSGMVKTSVGCLFYPYFGVPLDSCKSFVCVWSRVGVIESRVISFVPHFTFPLPPI